MHGSSSFGARVGRSHLFQAVRCKSRSRPWTWLETGENAPVEATAFKSLREWVSPATKSAELWPGRTIGSFTATLQSQGGPDVLAAVKRIARPNTSSKSPRQLQRLRHRCCRITRHAKQHSFLALDRRDELRAVVEYRRDDNHRQ